MEDLSTLAVTVTKIQESCIKTLPKYPFGYSTFDLLKLQIILRWYGGLLDQFDYRF